MHFLIHPTPCVVIELPFGDFEKCNAFAHSVFDSNRDCYQGRRQTNKEEIIRQIITGKLGELAVYYFMNSYLGWHSNETDFEIYAAKNKSFGPDFRAGDIKSDSPIFNIHVKSILCTSAKKYGLSWLMEKNDPIFKNTNDMSQVFAFCQVIGKRIVHFYGFLPLPMVRLGQPRIKSLESKYAIYFEDQDREQVKYSLNYKK